MSVLRTIVAGALLIALILFLAAILIVAGGIVGYYMVVLYTSFGYSVSIAAIDAAVIGSIVALYSASSAAS